MSRNGSGTYNLPAGNPVVTGTTISSTWANNTMNDIASALTGSVAADGQTPMTGNLNANNNKIVNVDDPTQAQDAATKTYVDAKTDGTSAGAFTTLTASDDVNFDSGTFFVDASADKVGIGTTTPSVQLETSFNFIGKSSVNAVNLGGTDTGVGFTGIKVAYKDATDLTNATSFPLQVFTNNAAQLTVTGTGNVGIGTSSPTTKLNVAGFVRSTSGANSVDIGHDGTNGSITSTNSLLQYATGNNPIILHTNGSQRMSIGGSGDVYIGTTSGTGKLNIQNASEGQLHLFYDSTYSWRQGPNNLGNYVLYRNIDSVGVYVAWGGTSWIANSDERIKTNLKPIENAVNKVSTLRTVTGRYKTDQEGISRSFLIAQDVQVVFPEAVNVQGDEQKTLGLSYTDMIPLLTAAIKEQQAIINDLKARIETLEAK